MPQVRCVRCAQRCCCERVFTGWVQPGRRRCSRSRHLARASATSHSTSIRLRSCVSGLMVSTPSAPITVSGVRGTYLGRPVGGTVRADLCRAAPGHRLRPDLGGVFGALDRAGLDADFRDSARRMLERQTSCLAFFAANSDPEWAPSTGSPRAQVRCFASPCRRLRKPSWSANWGVIYRMTRTSPM